MESNTNKHVSGRPETWLIRRIDNGRVVDALAVAITTDEEYRDMLEVSAEVSNGSDGRVWQEHSLLLWTQDATRAHFWAGRITSCLHAYGIDWMTSRRDDNGV